MKGIPMKKNIKKIVLVLAAALSAAADAAPVASLGRKVKYALLPAALVLFMIALPAVRRHEARWTEQISRIEEAAAAGEGSVTAASVPSVSRYTMGIALQEEASMWPNSTMSKYFGISVEGEK